MMKKKLALAFTSVCILTTLTGCVKVIDKGTEGQYTGEVAFDAAADSSSDWTQIAEEISGNAADVTEVLNGNGIGSGTVAVKGSGTVTELITKGPKNILAVQIDGYTGDDTFQIQVGSVYSGTALRDIQTLKNFEAFTNQTEWSQYGKALNAEMHAQVIEPLGIDESIVGKKITFTGAATQSGSDVTITPSQLTVE
jgi:predicted lipoprotein